MYFITYIYIGVKRAIRILVSLSLQNKSHLFVDFIAHIIKFKSDVDVDAEPGDTVIAVHHNIISTSRVWSKMFFDIDRHAKSN